MNSSFILHPSHLGHLAQLLGLLQRLVNAADHVEGLLRHVVVLAVEDFAEAAHCLGRGHVLALSLIHI